jgi:AcrR family transcriptional regulator
VLEEAAKALNSRGVSQTSLADIAARVGVSRAALYYYFEDQQDLVFQSYRRSCEIMARVLSEARERGGSAMTVIDAFVDGLLSDDAPEFAGVSEAAFLRPDQRSTIMGLYHAIMADLGTILQQGARDSELRACDPRYASAAIIGLVCWIPMARRWRTSDPLSKSDMVDAIKSFLAWGVAGDRRAPADCHPFDLTGDAVPVGRVFDAEALANAKQEALLAAASWLFNLKGVDATSLEEIALRMGVTKKVIYHNVGDKEALVMACYRRSFRFFEDMAARIGDQGGLRIDAVCSAMHSLAEAALREDIAPLSPLGGFEALPEAFQEEINGSSQRMMSAYLAIYERGQAEGSIRKFYSLSMLAMNPGFLVWLPKWFGTLTKEERNHAAAETAMMVRLGLRVT